MENNIKLEQYLGKLEKGLGQIPVSEKAEIITEIKSHILDAKAKDDSKKIEDILAAIGEPELVANRYLIERGLKPMKAPTHPIFKWLIIGFLGTFAIIVLFITVLIWRFTPIMKIHDDKVTLLGGTIDVDKDSESYFSRTMNIGNYGNFEERTFDFNKIKSVSIQNGSGDIKINSIKKGDAVLRVERKGYKCDLAAKLDANGELTVTTSDKHHCSSTSIEADLPPNTNIKVKTSSGNININSVHGNVKAQTGSGDLGVYIEKNTRSNLELVTGSGNLFVALPKGATVNYSLTSGSGKVDSDFVSKKDGNIVISAKTGSGDLYLKVKK